jgi:hypothetical protein
VQHCLRDTHPRRSRVLRSSSKENERLLGVAIHSYHHQDLDNISDVKKSLLDQSRSSLCPTTNSAERNSRSGQGGPKKAVKFLKARMRVYDDARKETGGGTHEGGPR